MNHICFNEFLHLCFVGVGLLGVLKEMSVSAAQQKHD